MYEISVGTTDKTGAFGRRTIGLTRHKGRAETWAAALRRALNDAGVQEKIMVYVERYIPRRTS